MLEGPILRGVVRDGDERFTPPEYMQQSISLYEEGSHSRPSDYSGRVQTDGTFVIRGAGPGRYKALGWPRRLAEETFIEILEGDRELFFELELAPVGR